MGAAAAGSILSAAGKFAQGGGIQGGIGLATGISKFFEGRKMQREAKKAMDNFKWQDLENAYKNLQVSTLGAELQLEENARGVATASDALRSGGNRAIVGGLGRVIGQSNTLNRQIAADLDAQQKNLDYAAAMDDAAIRGMQEKRQQDELAGYGTMMNTGMGMKYQGIANVMDSVGMLAGATTKEKTKGTSEAMVGLGNVGTPPGVQLDSYYGKPQTLPDISQMFNRVTPKKPTLTVGEAEGGFVDGENTQTSGGLGGFSPLLSSIFNSK